MARFNVSASKKYLDINHEGDSSYKLTPEMELYSMVCTSALQPKFYVPNTNDQLNKIKTALRNVDPLFAAQLAVYAREKMYLRSIPLVLAVELTKIYKGNDDLIRRLTKRVVQRADEITELLSYYVKANKKEPKVIKTKGNHTTYKTIHGLSNQMNKGIKDLFESGKFNEYQLAKYNRKTEIKLRDALFLSHPKPQNQEQKDLFNKLANNDLDIPYTWEVEMSMAGEIKGSKKEVWENMIDSGKMGYMAMLRNLRNFVKEGISNEHIYKVAERLSDYEQVKRSKQLPFRFLSAYRALGQNPARNMYWGENDYATSENENCHPALLRALEKAVCISVENIPMFTGEDVLIATDVSGSMQHTFSERGTTQLFDIGTLLAMLLQNRCANATVGMFGDTWKVLDDLPSNNILEATNEVHKREGEVGYSTNGWKILDWCLKTKKKYDRIMIFTDCQMWNSNNRDKNSINRLWYRYRSISPKTKLYLFDLSGYGGSPLDMRDNNVHLISGWSEKIFNVMSNIEQGGSSLDEIKEIKL